MRALWSRAPTILESLGDLCAWLVSAEWCQSRQRSRVCYQIGTKTVESAPPFVKLTQSNGQPIVVHRNAIVGASPFNPHGGIGAKHLASCRTRLVVLFGFTDDPDGRPRQRSLFVLEDMDQVAAALLSNP